MGDVRARRRFRGGGWQMIALLAIGVVVMLGVLCRSVLADDGGSHDPSTEQPAGQESAPAAPDGAQTGDGSAAPGSEGAPVGTPGRADESGPVVLPARPAASRPKLDGVLAAIAETAAQQGDAAALMEAQSRSAPVVGGSVRVLIQCVSADLTNVEAAILAAGGTIEASYADAIQALLPPSGLDQVAASPDVRMVRSPAGRTPDGPPTPVRAR